MPEADRRGAAMVIKRRKKKPRSRKPWELGSEGEETSDGSSSEKVCDSSPCLCLAGLINVRFSLVIFDVDPSFLKKQYF